MTSPLPMQACVSASERLLTVCTACLSVIRQHRSRNVGMLVLALDSAAGVAQIEQVVLSAGCTRSWRVTVDHISCLVALCSSKQIEGVAPAAFCVHIIQSYPHTGSADSLSRTHGIELPQWAALAAFVIPCFFTRAMLMKIMGALLLHAATCTAQRAGEVVVEEAHVCYGGVAAKCIMAPQVQQALQGQPWSQATFEAALKACAEDVKIHPDAPGWFWTAV